MLKKLKLKNYILVTELEIEFSSGLNIFSGETGAGKSVLVEAINTVMGGSVRRGMLFKKDEAALIELTFTLTGNDRRLDKLIEKTGIDVSEGELYFSKIIKPGLKSVSYLNGIRSTNNIIRSYRKLLIDFNSQRDQQQLLDNSYQLKIIDAYGNLEKYVNKFQNIYHNYENKLNQYQNLLKIENENKGKYDLYTYQVDEIKKSTLRIGEDTDLEDELNLLTHAEVLKKLENEFRLQCFESENSVFDELNKFLVKLQNFASEHSQAAVISSHLEECMVNLQDAAEGLSELKNSIDLDPEILDNVNSRLDYLNLLKMKYKKSISEILEYYDEIVEFVEGFSSAQDNIQKLGSELENDLNLLYESASALTEERKKSSLKFSRDIRKDIRQLSMPAADVKVNFGELTDNKTDFFQKINIQGKDVVDFLFTANKGKEMQPLKIAASGGEMSRFLLSVKKLLASELPSQTIIFDEIDSGIGGKTAEITGTYISDIAGYHQVICITHLAQIAVYAEVQFHISKVVESGISQIKVKKLDNNQKVREIARMLSGSDSDSALKHAGELLKYKNRKQNV